MAEKGKHVAHRGPNASWNLHLAERGTKKEVPPLPMTGAEDVGITSSLRRPSLVSSLPSLPPEPLPLVSFPLSLPWCSSSSGFEYDFSFCEKYARKKETAK